MKKLYQALKHWKKSYQPTSQNTECTHINVYPIFQRDGKKLAKIFNKTEPGRIQQIQQTNEHETKSILENRKQKRSTGSPIIENFFHFYSAHV